MGVLFINGRKEKRGGKFAKEEGLIGGFLSRKKRLNLNFVKEEAQLVRSKGEEATGDLYGKLQKMEAKRPRVGGELAGQKGGK